MIMEKVYYSIGEVSEMFSVNPSLIRFWEKEFPSLHPQKSKKGNRMFSQKDLEELRLIYSLVKEKGYTIQGAREYLSANRAGLREEQAVVRKLENIRKTLLEIRDSL